ncbi:MAG TPA: spermidine/putrescine ABC transporter substrate-binding protein [Rhodospirillaceae bacterium]|nr:spermidine/putrescine ABC transporter substrate-binding protein [Rhodospirillaceae bacterium]MBB58873.1 spermidine/putrescine ABC transporter substrate-binding protein [Rhodospirillaceae bacterium]HAJ21994.1 spermidine/putrescine ABC transporter substrate-binding protein [Rhodospirillaceae bacterium]|tara:strand:+ start:107518 stop:108645 length:1128 start_codon:yes stop_codon:yes gene_type:complete
MSVTRRSLLKSSAAATAVAIAAPAILRAHDALASSGQVDVYAWGDYIKENMIQKFEGDTGIKINLSTYGSNDEAENKLRAAGGKGFDVIFPSITNGPNYYPDNLLAPLDESKVNMDNIIPSMVRDSFNLGATYRGKRYLLPFDWGTEAITFDSEKMPMSDADVSYGSLWVPEAKGGSAFRQKSAIMGVAIYLDAIGEVPSNRALDLYKSEEDARRVWDACTKFILDHKENIAAFWNNATEATSAFTDSGAIIGQTWDTTGLLLNRENAKWKYRMPKEGGITWMDSMGVTSGAANTDQAYAFINAMLEPEMGGMFAMNTGYNSAVKGAADFAGDEYQKQFNEVYTDAALANLWWWQADTPYFASLRQEYVEKITNS